ncbi:hypothetical protein LXL04_004631 [Taraxacum kok-saghyz]
MSGLGGFSRFRIPARIQGEEENTTTSPTSRPLHPPILAIDSLSSSIILSISVYSVPYLPLVHQKRTNIDEIAFASSIKIEDFFIDFRELGLFAGFGFTMSSSHSDVCSNIDEVSDIIADGVLKKKYSYSHKGSKYDSLIQDAYVILCSSINKVANNEDELTKLIKLLQEVDSGITLCNSSKESSSRSAHIENILRAPVLDAINTHNPIGIRKGMG